MKRSIIVAMIIIAFILVTAIYLFATAESIDKSCNSDSECVMKQIDCEICPIVGEGDAVNYLYEPHCPDKSIAVCPDEAPSWASRQAVCVQNRCKAV